MYMRIHIGRGHVELSLIVTIIVFVRLHSELIEVITDLRHSFKVSLVAVDGRGKHGKLQHLF